jgi:hypothetical protein
MTAPAPASSPPHWSAVLEQQDQVISRRQARLGGLSEDQWQWLLDSDRWQAVLPGVAVAHSGEITARQRAWAGVLYAGAGARLSGDVALIEHGLRLPAPSTLAVAVPEKRKVAGRRLADDSARLEPHRVLHLERWSHPVRQPPVLRVGPAALHAAAWAASDRAAEWRLAATVQQRLIRAADLRRVVGEMPRLRRRQLVLDVLDDIELGAHAASELDFLRFLRRHELPPPDRLQRPVRTGKICYLDAWWERQRVSAEMDGVHHRLVGTWEDDALRANDVVLVEKDDRILLLRFTRGNLRHDEARVAGQLRDALL